MRLNPFFPPPPPAPKLNELIKQKKTEGSQYRTHFTLMNVYCPTPSNYDHFILRISQKLKKYVNCDIVQISEIVDDDRVDLAVGLQNDKEAMSFLLNNQEIKIDTEKYGQQTYKLLVSNVFKIYMKVKKQLYPKALITEVKNIEKQQNILFLDQNTRSPIKNTVKTVQNLFPHKNISRSGSSSSYASSSNSNHSPKIKAIGIKQADKPNRQIQRMRIQKGRGSRSRSRSKSHKSHNKNHNIAKVEAAVYQISFNQTKTSSMVQEIWIFCIPLEFDEREVQARLKQRRIYPQYGSSNWKMIEDMQFLEVRLEKPISLDSVRDMDLKIGRYAFVVMEKLKAESEIQLKRQIKKYQSQLISQNPINQQIFIGCLLDIGGVVSVIKDDYDFQQKYIVSFNTVSKVKQFQLRCQQVFGTSVRISGPYEPIRLCRTQKMFSIENILIEYAQKLKGGLY